MIKKLTLVFIWLAFSVVVAQQEEEPISIPSDIDQELNKRAFGDKLTDKYNGSEFEYSSQEGAAQNLIERFLKWFSNLISDSLGIDLPPNTLQIIEYLIYIFMGLLVLYLIIRFVAGEKLSTLFTKKAKSIIDINLSEDHIENVDLDALMNEALSQKDYRLAVRYQFLRVLKLLSQKGIIDWHFEKTNSDYHNEIQEQKLKTSFNNVTYLYDNIWYGEQDIDGLKYEAAEAKFKDLKRMLSL